MIPDERERTCGRAKPSVKMTGLEELQGRDNLLYGTHAHSCVLLRAGSHFQIKGNFTRCFSQFVYCKNKQSIDQSVALGSQASWRSSLPGMNATVHSLLLGLSHSRGAVAVPVYTSISPTCDVSES